MDAVWRFFIAIFAFCTIFLVFRFHFKSVDIYRPSNFASLMQALSVPWSGPGGETLTRTLGEGASSHLQILRILMYVDVKVEELYNTQSKV